MQQTINLNFKGDLEIKLFDKDNNLIWEKFIHNTLLDNYKNIVRRALAGEAELDQIIAYDEFGGVLYIGTISQVTHNGTVNNKSTFICTFSESSFDGTIAEVVLCSSLHGEFSRVSGLDLTKTSTQVLQIAWTLTILNI